MGIRYTLRNRHRQKDFLQVGAAVPKPSKPAKKKTAAEKVIDNGISRDEALNDAYIRRSRNLTDKVVITKLANQKKQDALNLARMRQNVEKPVHDVTEGDSFAKLSAEISERVLAEQRAKLESAINKNNNEANARIRNDTLQLASMDENLKRLQYEIEHPYVPVKPTPQEQANARAVQINTQQRAKAIQQARDTTRARLESIKAARDEKVSIMIQKAKIGAEIHGWVKVRENMGVVVPMVQRSSSLASQTRAKGNIKVYRASERVTSHSISAETSIRATNSAEKVVAETFLTNTGDPDKIFKLRADARAKVTTLSRKNLDLTSQLGKLSGEVTARADALPSLISAAKTLTDRYTAAVDARKRLQDARDGLQRPDSTSGQSKIYDLNRKIGEADAVISKIADKLSELGGDIMGTLRARDTLIALKARDEGDLLRDLHSGVTGLDPEIASSKANLDAAEATQQSIKTVLENIKAAVEPYASRRSDLQKLIRDIQAHLNTKITPLLVSDSAKLKNKTEERDAAIKLLSDTIVRNSEDSAILKLINDTITTLSDSQNGHQARLDSIESLLNEARRLEGIVQSGSGRPPQDAIDILNYVTNVLGPSLINSAENESTAANAYGEAAQNVQDATSRISSNRAELVRLNAIRDTLVTSISNRSETIRKLLYSSSMASSKALVRSAKAAAEFAKAAARANKGEFGSRTVDVKRLKELQSTRDGLAGRISDTGDIGGPIRDTRIQERDARINAESASRSADSLRQNPPDLSRVGPETSQAADLAAQRSNLGQKPDSITEPSFNPPEKPPSSQAVRDALAGITVPPQPVDGTPAAKLAKDAAKDAATSFANPADAVASLADVTAIAQGLEGGLKTQGAEITSIEGSINGAITDTAQSSSKLEGDARTLGEMGTDLQGGPPVRPDSRTVEGLQDAIPALEGAFPTPHVDSPSHSPDAAEAMARAGELSDALDVLVGSIFTAGRSIPSTSDISRKMQDIKDFVDGELARASAEAQTRYADLLARDPSAELANLKNAQDTRAALEKIYNTGIIQRGTLFQSLADLGKLYLTRENRYALQIIATAGAESAASSRSSAQQRRNAAEIARLNRATKGEVTAAVGDVIGSNSRRAELEAQRLADQQTIGLADAGILAADITSATVGKIIAEGSATSEGGALAGVDSRIAAELAQVSALEGQLNNLTPPGDAPTRPVDNRGEAKANADAAHQAAEAARGELAGLRDPGAPDRTALTAAELAKDAALDVAPPEGDPQGVLTDAQATAAALRGQLESAEPGLISIGDQVQTAAEANRLKADKLAEDNAAAAAAQQALDAAKEARRASEDEVTDADPTPFEEGVARAESDVPPHQDPPQPPSPNDSGAYTRLGEAAAEVAAAARLKRINDDQITYVEGELGNPLNNVDTSLFLTREQELLSRTQDLSAALKDLTNAMQQYREAVQKGTDTENAIKNLSDTLKALKEQLAIRKNLGAALVNSKASRIAYSGLRNALKVLRDGAVNRPKTKDGIKINTTDLITRLNETIDALASKKEQKAELDANLSSIDTSSAVSDKAAARGEKNAAELAAEQARIRLGENESRMRAESDQALSLEGQLGNLTDPGDPLNRPVDNRDAAKANADAAHQAAEAAREALAGLQDPGPPDRTRLDDAQANKKQGISDAEALQKSRIDDAESALNAAKRTRDGLDGELKYALERLEATLAEVQNVEGNNQSSADALAKAKAEAAERLAAVDELKAAVKDYSDTIDKINEILRTIHVVDVPPRDPPPGPPPPREDHTAALNEVDRLLTQLVNNHDAVLRRIEIIRDKIPDLTDDINHALQRVSDLFTRVHDASTDLVLRANDLLVAKSGADNLDSLNQAALRRIDNLKRLKEALEKYSSIVDKRTTEYLKAKAEADARFRAIAEARRAKEAALNAEKRAKKDDITLKLQELTKKLADLEAKKAERDKAGKLDKDADAEIAKIKRMMLDLEQSLLGKRMKELADANAKRKRVQKDRDGVDGKIRDLEQRLKDAIDRYGEDSDEVRKLRDELERLKKIRDELDRILKDLDDKIKKLKNDLDDIRKRIKDLEDALNRLKKQLDRKRGNVHLPSVIPVIGSNTAAIAGVASALGGLVGFSIFNSFSGNNTPSNPLTDCEDGKTAGRADGLTAGKNDGSSAGYKYASNESNGSSFNPFESLNVGATDESANENMNNTSNDNTNDDNPNNAEPVEDANEEEPVEAPPENPNAENEELGSQVISDAQDASDKVTNIQDALDKDAFAPLTPPDPIPGPGYIPTPPANPFKSVKYNSCYMAAYRQGYIDGYEGSWLKGFHAFNNTHIPKLPMDQQPGINNEIDVTYNLQSEKYGINGDYTFKMQGDGEYYEFNQVGSDTSKTVLVLVDDITYTEKDMDIIDTYKSHSNVVTHFNEKTKQLYNLSEGDFTNKMVQTDNYKHFVGADGTKLIILSSDLEGNSPAVKQTEATTTEEVEPNPPESSEPIESQSGGYQLVHDDEVTPTL